MNRFASGSCTTTKCQGCRLPPFGAWVAASSTRQRRGSGTGSGLSRRMARIVAIASKSSISIVGLLSSPARGTPLRLLDLHTGAPRRVARRGVVHPVLEMTVVTDQMELSAEEGSRTPTPLRAEDFESSASASSATSARTYTG